MLWEKRRGLYYVCIGALGGYGRTAEEAADALLRRAQMAERLFVEGGAR